MRFNPNLLELIPKEQLDADFGGDHHFEFEKDSYWQQVVECVLFPSSDQEIFTVILRFCGIAADGTRVEKEKEVATPVSATEGAQTESEPAKAYFTAQSDTATSVPLNLRLHAHIKFLIY